MSKLRSLGQTIICFFFSKDNRRNNLIVFLVLLIIILLFSMLYFYSPDLVINSESLRISGLYGLEIPLASINKIEFREQIPGIEKKIIGIDAFGLAFFGRFELEDLGKGRLFILNTDGPFILVYYDNTYAIISYRDPEKTYSVYREIERKSGL